MDFTQLEFKSKKFRYEIFEKAIDKKIGHLGGTYSCIEILVSLYYGEILNIDSTNFQSPTRNRFILSKGHACLALYSVLKDLNLISEQTYQTYCLSGGLGAQLDISIPGVDWNTGSLGHSLGILCGMGIGLQNEGHVFTLVGDSECAEGSFWEAIFFASEQNINNLTCIIDRNRFSVTDELGDDSFFKIMPSTLKSLGWNFLDIDGHKFETLIPALQKSKNSQGPTMIVANTIKGKGISYMENTAKWHHSLPGQNEIEIARKELQH